FLQYVRSGGQSGQEAPAEIPEPAGADLRDPAAASGLDIHPPPDQRRAALRGAGLAALDARREPVFRGRVQQDQALRRPLAGEAVPAGAGVGLLPPFLRRHPLPVSRPRQGRRPGNRAPHQLDRAGHEPRPDRFPGLENLVTQRIITGAHYGLRDWLAQKITAVIMAVYSVIALIVLLSGVPLSFVVWKDLFSQGWMRVATLLFMVSLAWHAWVGVRDILMDYIKLAGLRLTLEVLALLTIAAYVGWTIQILWR